MAMATRPLVKQATSIFSSVVGAEVEKYEWFLVFDDGGFPIIAARAFIKENPSSSWPTSTMEEWFRVFGVESPERFFKSSTKQRERIEDVTNTPFGWHNPQHLEYFLKFLVW